MKMYKKSRLVRLTCFLVSFLVFFTTFYSSIAMAGEKPILITSTPSDATIYINEQRVGKTPGSMIVKGRWWYESAPTIRLEKEGYEPFTTTLSRNQLNIGGLVGTILCLFPALWLLETPDSLHYTLIKK